MLFRRNLLAPVFAKKYSLMMLWGVLSVTKNGPSIWYFSLGDPGSDNGARVLPRISPWHVENDRLQKSYYAIFRKGRPGPSVTGLQQMIPARPYPLIGGDNALALASTPGMNMAGPSYQDEKHPSWVFGSTWRFFTHPPDANPFLPIFAAFKITQ